MFEYCKNCKKHDDCFNNHWCVTMDKGRKIEGEYICDNFEPTLNSKIIFLRDIVKLQHYYIEIFEEEDSDFVNYKRVGALYRQVYKILNSITDVEQDKTKIYDIIGHGSWNSKDHSFKPICDDIRKLGYKVVERMKTCCSADCPKTDSRIISQLCEWWYPYGSKTKCGNMFNHWLKTEKEVQQIHNEYLKKVGTENEN